MKVKAKYVLVQTKVSPATDDRLERICKEYKFASKYELLQHLISVFLKYADPEAEMESENNDNAVDLAKMFSELQNCGQRVNTAAPNAAKTLVLSEAIQIYQRLGRNGVVAAKYTFGKNGSFTKTENNSRILRSVLRRLFPSLNRELAKICNSLGGVEVDDAIAFLCKQTDSTLSPDLIEREVSNEFQSLSIAEKHVDMTGNKPKRRQSKNINDIRGDGK